MMERGLFSSPRARPPYECDQIFIMNTDGSGVKLLSTGQGATTCSFFFPGGKRFLYASTHAGGSSCPPEPDRSQGYVWPLFESYDIYAADLGADSDHLDVCFFVVVCRCRGGKGNECDWLSLEQCKQGAVHNYNRYF